MATYTTKFNNEDKVYFLRNNQIVLAQIKKTVIALYLGTTEPNICYEVQYKEPGTVRLVDGSFNETYFFRTKEELVASLIEQYNKAHTT